MLMKLIILQSMATMLQATKRQQTTLYRHKPCVLFAKTQDIGAIPEVKMARPIVQSGKLL